MRKFIIALLLITFQSAPAFAAEYSDTEYCSDQSSNHSDGAQAGCNAAAGCQWNSTTNQCTPCPTGTYKQAGETTCVSCGTTGTGTKWQTQTGTRSQNDCQYTATCAAPQYFGGYSTGCVACSAHNNARTGTFYFSTNTTQNTYSGTVGTSTSNQSSICKTCGKNSTTTTNGLGCQCNTGYHVNGADNTNTTTNSGQDCVINKYTITYEPNGGNGSSITQSINHGTSVILKNASTFTRDGYNLNSWQNKATSATYAPGATITNGFTSDITLRAIWSGKQFQITYNVGDADTTCAPPTQTCTYGTTCNAQDIPSGCIHAGYIFEKWTYNNNDIAPGTDIANISNGANMTLTAVWTQCPAGYYCPSIKKSDTNPGKCPAGSTSGVRSSAITNCHMTGGETQICDSDSKCFTIPGDENVKIYYHGGQ